MFTRWTLPKSPNPKAPTQKKEGFDVKKTIYVYFDTFALFGGGSALANTKIGMITTLSGGAGLGIDVRDGFMLAIEQAKRANIDVIIADDQRKADIAVKLADQMIQADKVDILTGIIWSNLCHGGGAIGNCAGQILSLAQCWSLAIGWKVVATPTILMWHGKMTICMKRRLMQMGRV